MTARTSPPLVRVRCQSCGYVFASSLVVGVPIGPGPWPEERERARRGDRFNVWTVEICRACAFGDEADPLPPKPSPP